MLIDPILMPVIYTGGVGIDVTGTSINLDPATVATINGTIQESQRDQPLGFAGLDTQSAINALVKVRYMTHSDLNLIVPAAGELVVTSDTKELRYGDGISNGGFSASLSSESCIYVSPTGGTALESGAAVVAAFQVAKSMNPYGQPKSATNRVTVLLGIGEYDFNNLFTFDVPFVDLVGISQQGVRCYVGNSLFRINDTATDIRCRNITFIKPVGQTSHAWSWQIPGDGTVNIYFENLTFEGSNTDLVFSQVIRSGGTFSNITGVCNNVRTSCINLFTSNAGIVNHTWAVNMTDCSASQMVGQSPSLNAPIVTGKWRRCILEYSPSRASHHFNCANGSIIQNCDWGYPMLRLETGSRVMYTRFKTQAPTAVQLNSAIAAQSVFIAHSEYGTGGLGTNIGTNTAGATAALACNVVSDG